MHRLDQTRINTFGYQSPPKLPDNYYDLKGEGVIDDIKDKISNFKTAVFNNRPKKLTDIMIATENNPIKSIAVCRKPINYAFQKILNIVTLGGLKKKMNDMGYDRLFHLYAVFELQDGRKILIEKNERVDVLEDSAMEISDKIGVSSCQPSTLVDGNKTIKDFIMIMEAQQIPGIYRYSSFKNNCQDFVKNLLNSNSINKYNDFISQNVESLAPSVLKLIVNKITDTAAIAHYFTRGGSLD